MEWRMAPEKWTRIDLDVNNPQQLASALEKVAETRKVTQDEARALGFWHSQAPEDNPMVDAQGMVEVPKWRHALINIAHPLLKQGLCPYSGYTWPECHWCRAGTHGEPDSAGTCRSVHPGR